LFGGIKKLRKIKKQIGKKIGVWAVGYPNGYKGVLGVYGPKGKKKGQIKKEIILMHQYTSVHWGHRIVGKNKTKKQRGR